MAGDWLKVEHATPDKPEVFEIAQELEMDPDAVFSKCFRVWCWFDTHTEDGNAPVTVEALLNRLSGCDKFVSAMEKVGWMRRESGRLLLPNHDRHTSKSAKSRGLNAKRQADHRARNATSVTKSVTREEKRREEKNKNLMSDPPGSDDGVKTPKPGKPEDYPPEFMSLWSEKPERINQNKRKALKAFNARVREGVSLEAMLNGLKAYNDHCDREGTEARYRMHLATFLGPDRHFEQTWETPDTVPDDIDGIRALAALHPEVDLSGLHWKQARKVLASQLGMRT